LGGARRQAAAAGLALALAVSAAGCAGPRKVGFLPVEPAEAARLRSIHDWKGGASLCQACHVRDDPAPALIRGEPVALCRGCHSQAHGGNHPVSVAVKGPTGGLPTWQGRVACTSCHDPHAIRVNRGFWAEPTEMCLRCHQRHSGAKAR
jgi:predicted CXXCH cytochrome family protein